MNPFIPFRCWRQLLATFLRLNATGLLAQGRHAPRSTSQLVNPHGSSKRGLLNSRLLLGALLLLGVGLMPAQAQTGTVFRDFNGNGTKDTNEPLVSGIVVNAYNTAGALCASATSTGISSPNYSLPTTCSGPLRIEFAIPATGNCVNSGIDFSSASGSVYGSSVQFVTATATNVNFAVHNPGDYNTGTTGVSAFVPCYVNGDPLGGGDAGTMDWYVGFNYTNTGTTIPQKKVNGTIIGSLWGVAYSKQAKKSFAAAFIKRHVGLGQNGSGAIYMMTETATSFTPTLFFDMDNNAFNTASAPETRTRALASAPAYGATTSYVLSASATVITYLGATDPLSGKPAGFGVVGTNTERGLLATKTSPSYDPAAFDQVGKVGIGDIDMSPDGKFLFVTNLFQRKVFRLELDDAATPTKVIAVTALAFPTTSCQNGVLRPFALEFDRGKLYLGCVCTAEASTGTDSDLSAKVYVYADPTGAATLTTTPVLDIPLDYQKGFAGGNTANPSPASTRFNHKWTDKADVLIGIDGTAASANMAYPQPVLSDIEFTTNGDMVLGFFDRTGHQWGSYNRQYLGDRGTGNNTLKGIYASGDIIAAGLNCSSGTFTLENNGSYVSANGTTYSSGAANGQGPGGSEFFQGEDFGNYHQETAQGGLALIKGQTEVMTIAMTPNAVQQGGVIRLSTVNGTQIAGYTLYTGTGTTNGLLGKANGLGDVELSGIEGPIEIGNRVWKDADNDGLQDAAETGIDGVIVQLYQGATLIASTLTANGGQYYFNSTSTTALQPNTAYTIKLGTAPGSGVLAACTGYSPLNTALAGNDANASGVVSVTTGNYGETAHTYDIGLISESCSLTTSATSTTCNPATNTYSVNGVISLTGTTGGTATITDGTKSTTVTVAASATSVTYSLTGLPSGTSSHTVTVSLPGCGTATATYTAPASCTVAPCGLVMTLTPGLCLSADNSYVLSGSLTATNVPTSGTLIISSGAFSPRSLTLPAANTASGTFSYSSLVSNGQTYTVTASYSNAACAPVSQTYTAPASCSVTPVCSISAVASAGLCATATNTYSATVAVALTNVPAGTITVSLPGSSPISQTLAANTSSFTAIFVGLNSDGASHMATISLPGCGSTTATFTAPASCSVTPICSISAVVTAGLCTSVTNTFSTTAVVTLTNPTVGVLTITDGPASQTFATSAVTTATFTAVFAGIISDGASHTVTATLPGCGTLAKTYTAPTSCSAVPVCSLSTTVTAGLCASATNTYSATAVVVVKNPTAGTLTVTNVGQSITFVTTATSSATFVAVFSNLLSDGMLHNVTVSLPGCSSTTATYTAPASCTVAPVCNLSLTASGSACNPITNQYVLSGSITLTNSPVSQTLTLTDGSYVRSLTANAGTTTINFSYTTLQSDGLIHTVTLVSSASACGLVSTTYTAPASCSLTPVCSVSAVVTAGLCSTATNTYSSTVLVTMTNPTAGVLTVLDGVRSVTFAVPATVGTVTTSATFNGLLSDGSTHPISVSLTGCSGISTSYAAPASCTACSLSLTTSQLPAGQVGQPYTANLTTTGGTAPLTYTLSAGTLPPGLSLDPATGLIAGTPTMTGSFTVSLSVTDSKGCTAYLPLTILNVDLGPVCSLSVTAAPTLCNTATNTYSLTGLVSLTNNSTGGQVVLTDGLISTTLTLSNTATSLPFALTGLISNGVAHTLLVTLAGCGTASTTYNAPQSCTSAPELTLEKRVNLSKAKLGDVLTYTLVLTNGGSGAASNVVVTDSSSVGLNYVAGSVSAPQGTTFTQGAPLSTWRVASLSAGQSLSLTFQARADSSGILYNKAYIPGDTAIVCTTVPVKMCAGEVYIFRLEVAPGRSSYKWYRNGVEIIGQTTNVLDVSAPGTYSLSVDNVSGKCPDFSCCPFIVEEDSLPTFQARAIPVTCLGNTLQTNGQIVLSQFNPAYTYQYSLGSTFNEAASLSGPDKVIPANGVLVSTLSNPAVAQMYTVRVYNETGCYTDQTVLLLPTVCGCPAEVCVPFVLKQSKRAKRVGDAR